MRQTEARVQRPEVSGLKWPAGHPRSEQQRLPVSAVSEERWKGLEWEWLERRWCHGWRCVCEQLSP